MNLSDSGRVEPRRAMFGKNANIEIRMEKQIEKWAFFRENVHRSFNYGKFSNYARGFVWLVIIPTGLMSLIMAGHVRISLSFFFAG